MCEASPARMRFSLSDLGGIGCWAAGEGSGFLKADRENPFVYQAGLWGVFGLTGARAEGVIFWAGGWEDRRMGGLNGRLS